MSSIEGEERFRFGEKWTATIFAGVACLYGDGGKLLGSANLYPTVSVGIQYVLHAKEGIVLNWNTPKAKMEITGSARPDLMNHQHCKPSEKLLWV